MHFNAQEIFEIIKSAAIIVASVAAIYGINAWRREGKWKRKYELGEETLSLFYDAEERLNSIRSPVTWNHEGKTRKRSVDERDDESEIFDSAYVVHERYEREKEPFVKLKAMKHRFTAVFGKEHSAPFDEVRKIINEIFLASERVWRERLENKRYGQMHHESEEYAKRSVERMEKYEKKLWADEIDSDEIKERMSKAIGQIEKVCNRILESQNIK